MNILHEIKYILLCDNWLGYSSPFLLDKRRKHPKWIERSKELIDWWGLGLKDITNTNDIFSQLTTKENISKWLDVNTYDFTDFDNGELVYCNSTILDKSRFNVDLYIILSEFKNPFSLVLVSSDRGFRKQDLKYLEIPNCKKIYTTKIEQDCTDDNLKILPVAIGYNKDSQEDFLKKLISKDVKKDNFIYFNFNRLTDWRGRKERARKECYDTLKNKISWVSWQTNYQDYLSTLSSYKYCICPRSKGIDTWRMWECFYLKVIPICDRNPLTTHFSKSWPIILLDDWKDIDLEDLTENYDKYNKWDNHYLLDFDEYMKYVGLI